MLTKQNRNPYKKVLASPNIGPTVILGGGILLSAAGFVFFLAIPLFSQYMIKLCLGPTVVVVSLFLLVASGLLFFSAIPKIVDRYIKLETRLVVGSDSWNKWVNVTAPVFIRFRIFNVTNADAVIDNGEKFDVQEIGPYTWEEKRIKQILSIDDEEDTVTYNEVVYYYFRRDLSVGGDDDLVDVANIPFIAAVTLLEKHLHGVTSILNYAVDYFVDEGERIVAKGIKVKDLLFEGVKLGSIYETLGEFEIVDLPAEFIDGTYAIYNGKNGTPIGPYKISRGIKDHTTFGQILSFDGKKDVPWWTNNSLPEGSEQYCNKINGSDGSIFRPFLTRESVLHGFSPEICRSLALNYDQDVNIHGIPAFRFTLNAQTLEHPDLNPDNVCFNTDPGHGVTQAKGRGALRIFTCKRDVPIVLSLPHFLYGSEVLHSRIRGLHPNKTLHESELVAEPNTGGLLRALKRIQVNVEIYPFADIESFEHYPHSVVPVAWGEERAELDEEGYAEIRNRLVIPLKVVNILQWVVLGTLLFAILVGVIVTIKNFRSKTEFRLVNHDMLVEKS